MIEKMKCLKGLVKSKRKFNLHKVNREIILRMKEGTIDSLTIIETHLINKKYKSENLKQSQKLLKLSIND